MNRQRAVFAIHIAAVLFGLTGIFGELIQADAMVITAGRAGFAVLALLAVMRSRRSSPLLGITRTTIWVLAMSGSMLAGHWVDRKGTRLNSSHYCASRIPSSS